MKGRPRSSRATGEGRQAVNVAAFETEQSYVDLRPPPQQSASRMIGTAGINDT